MFRRCISSQLNRLLVCSRPSPYLKTWTKFKSNDSHSNPSSWQPSITSFQFEPPMCGGILTTDLSKPGPSPSIKQVRQKVCIVGRVRNLKVSGNSHPGNGFLLNRKGRLYHKDTSRDPRDFHGRPRPRPVNQRYNKKISKRLNQLMSEGVDGTPRTHSRREEIQVIRESPKSRSDRSYPDDTEDTEYYEYQDPGNSIRNFITMLVSKGKKVRQQLEEGKRADLMKYHPGIMEKMQRYHYKYKKHKRIRPRPKVRKTQYNDRPIDSAVLDVFRRPQKEEVIMLGGKSKVTSNSKSSEEGRTSGCQEESVKDKEIPTSSLEIMKAREEKLICKAQEETNGRLQSLKKTTSIEIKPPENMNSDKVQPKVSQSQQKTNDQQTPFSSSGQEIKNKKIDGNLQKSCDCYNKFKLELVDPYSEYCNSDQKKPGRFYDIFKNKNHKHLWEHTEYKPGSQKSPNYESCDKPTDSSSLDDQSCNESLHDLFKDQVHQNLWELDDNDRNKGSTKDDYCKCFQMLDEKDKVKFRIAELMAKCMFLVEKKIEAEDGESCNGKEFDKDENASKLVKNFWKHYMQCRKSQGNDVCRRSKSSITNLESTDHCIMEHVDVIVKQCERIKQAIESRSLKKKCTKESLNKSIKDELRKAEEELEKQEGCVNDKTSGKAEKCDEDLVEKMKRVIEELQEKLAEDEGKTKCDQSSKECLSELKKKCLEMELEEKCEEEKLREKCALEELKDKCSQEYESKNQSEEDLQEKFKKFKKKCKEQELKKHCAKEKLEDKCAEEELKQKCAEEELKEKCKLEELKKKCAFQKFKEKCEEAELEERCAREEERRKCQELSLRRRCAEFSLRKRCENYAKQMRKPKDDKTKDSEDELRKKCAELELGKKREEDELKKKSAEENDKKQDPGKKNKSTFEKIKKKVGLTGKSKKDDKPVDKFALINLRKWYDILERRKKSAEEEIRNWRARNELKRLRKEKELIKQLQDQGRKENPESKNRFEIQGLGLFLRTGLARPKRGYQELDQCDPILQKGSRERFPNPCLWPLLPRSAFLYKPTAPPTPLLEKSCCPRGLLPELKALTINDTLGVLWLSRITPSNPFSKRGYKRDELRKGSSLLWPFAAIIRGKCDDESSLKI
ncbi:axoneme-associated protein mst101(2) [Drosophila eugracilis]|uniref:axoneme-associated protein mst101(2) n=1 Tax=Drosophila eugracilis TaxID=29029 RepID=UPI0007E5C8C2|nr:axoneme-associated protein mst101(2) [Drosophila eugracilis]